MLVNLDEMSAEQLFELANRKKQAEAEAAKRAAAEERVNEVRKRREQLTREYEQALAANGKEMQALQKQREQLITKHQAALALVDKTLAELEEDIRGSEPPVAKPATASRAAAAEPETAAPARRGGDKGERTEELADVVMDIMVGRQTISESLLKEQLRSRGHSAADLGKVLEQLVREGRLASRGYGNYAPGKKR